MLQPWTGSMPDTALQAANLLRSGAAGVDKAVLLGIVITL